MPFNDDDDDDDDDFGFFPYRATQPYFLLTAQS